MPHMKKYGTLDISNAPRIGVKKKHLPTNKVIMEKVSFLTTPVDWFGEKPLKYQSSAEYKGRRIFGDPMPTEKEAFKSLAKEVKDWKEIVSEVEIAIKNQKK